ncbi:polysaccharide biosynthesis/export family protein [Halochromatium glycolicum]|uniref:polysaccharide biosynthesis/export family protein n=1 Tax=Halochromatium glycolicum TaxID=85075 RepID=UPI00190B6F18|nr:polysaccharide biosynthesis/export family protein [Halochromatium glycolicum]
MYLRQTLVVAILGCLVLCAAFGARGGEDQVPGALDRLGPGDSIQVIVWRLPELSQRVVISPTGKIQYPLVGEIQAAGLTAPELSAKLAEALRRHMLQDEEPEVTVSLEALNSYRIYVMGEVMSPGELAPRSAITLVQALAMAGGFTAYAKRKDILVYNRKADRAPIRFDYKAFIDGAEDSEDPLLLPGDTVIVR